MSKEVQVLSGKMKMISNEETKRQIVRESYESGMSLNKFAKERGVSPATLCMWRKKFPQAQCAVHDLISLQQENENLKREIVKIKAYLGHKLFEFERSKIVF